MNYPLPQPLSTRLPEKAYPSLFTPEYNGMRVKVSPLSIGGSVAIETIAWWGNDEEEQDDGLFAFRDMRTKKFWISVLLLTAAVWVGFILFNTLVKRRR